MQHEEPMSPMMIAKSGIRMTKKTVTSTSEHRNMSRREFGSAPDLPAVSFSSNVDTGNIITGNVKKSCRRRREYIF